MEGLPGTASIIVPLIAHCNFSAFLLIKHRVPGGSGLSWSRQVGPQLLCGYSSDLEARGCRAMGVDTPRLRLWLRCGKPQPRHLSLSLSELLWPSYAPSQSVAPVRGRLGPGFPGEGLALTCVWACAHTCVFRARAEGTTYGQSRVPPPRCLLSGLARLMPTPASHSPPRVTQRPLDPARNLRGAWTCWHRRPVLHVVCVYGCV